jgi:hypothetical protein
MKTVLFLVAGNKTAESELNNEVFLQSNNRRYDMKDPFIYHRNDFTTFYYIPMEFYKDNFKYERQSGIYRNDLTYSDLLPYAEIIDHRIV